MNNENKPSVIAELTAALASMAERAAAAEAEAEQYKKSSGEWYQFFTSKDKDCLLYTSYSTGLYTFSELLRISVTSFFV